MLKKDSKLRIAIQIGGACTRYRYTEAGGACAQYRYTENWQYAEKRQ